MTPELEAALERARNHKMTPEEVFEQRVSWCYGMSDGHLTKDEVRHILATGRMPD